MSKSIFADLSPRPRAGGRSLLRTAFDRVVEARERQARRYVAQWMTRISRDELGGFGVGHQSPLDGRMPERH